MSNPQQQMEVISNVNENNYCSLPVIEACAGSLNFKALCDTGSSICILSPEIFEKIKSQIKVKYITRHCKILTMTGHNVEFSACATIAIKIGNQPLTHDFFVAKQPFGNGYKSIFGYDLFRKHNAQLNLEGKFLRINNAKVPILEANDLTTNSLEIQNCPVSLKNKIILNPGESHVIEVSFGKNIIPDNTEVLFEPKQLKSNCDLGTSIHITKNNGIKIAVTNMEAEKLVLNKHMCLGYTCSNFEIEQHEQETVELINLIVASEEVIELRKKEFKLEDFNLGHLGIEEMGKLENLLEKYFVVFSSSLKTLGHTDKVKPSVQLVNELPVACKNFSIPFALRAEAKKMLNELLEVGIISKSTSNYAAPMLLVKKASDTNQVEGTSAKNAGQKLRLVIDFRAINNWVTTFPVRPPKINDIVNELSGYRYYSTCDLNSAFWQLDMPKDVREKLAFTSMFGQYEFNRMPYGYKNSPAYFLSLMNECLKDVGPGIHWYMDDIIITANSLEEMLERLEKVFKTFTSHNLTLSPTKCKFFKTHIDFLGYNISENGITPVDKNIKKIVGFLTPKTTKQLKRFLGVAGFYRHMIRDYSQLAGILESMTSKKSKFNWTLECDQVFNKLQQKFFEKPFLTQPDLEKTFYIITDASGFAISGILAQKVGEEMKPISYFSKKLSASQQKYSAIKSEMYAIYETIKHFRDYLFTDFVVLCDHKPLEYHKKLQNPTSVICNWLLYLQDFSFTVQHIAGKNNKLADYISRNDMVVERSPFEVKEEQIVNNVSSTQGDSKVNEMVVGDEAELSVKMILSEQLKDSQLSVLRKDIETNSLKIKQPRGEYFIDRVTKLLKHVETIKNNLGQTNCRETIVVPTSLKRAALHIAHFCHFGILKSYSLLKERFYWIGMYGDIKNYILSCDRCLSVKANKQKHIPHGMTQHGNFCGDMAFTDIVGPLVSGKYLLTIIDGFSKFLEVYVISNIRAETIADCIIRYFTTYGRVNRLFSDQGTQYKSEIMRLVNKAFGTKIIHSLPYSPWQNQVERAHQSLKNTIYTLDEDIPNLILKVNLHKAFYNGSVHPATGFKPCQIFLSRDVKMIFDNLTDENDQELMSYPVYVRRMRDTMKKMHDAVLKNQRVYKEIRNANSKQKSVNRIFKVGDLIYTEYPFGFKKKRFSGPSKVVKVISEHTLEIFDGIKKSRISVARVKLAKKRRKHLDFPLNFHGDIDMPQEIRAQIRHYNLRPRK